MFIAEDMIIHLDSNISMKIYENSYQYESKFICLIHTKKLNVQRIVFVSAKHRQPLSFIVSFRFIC